jgi:hypothetical protein
LQRCGFRVYGLGLGVRFRFGVWGVCLGLGFGFRVSELVPTAELKGRIFDIACKLLKPRARTEGRGDRGADG